MPLRRAIGISLACLVTSACATGIASEAAIAPEESQSDHPADAAGLAPQNAEMPADKSRGLPCGTARKHRAADDPSLTDACGGTSERCCSQLRAAGRSQVGKGVWYDHVGRPTASGEVLDTVTATAAHRSLPLASFAKVTNLDNGRSVVVKINDRGPYTRGRIIDLSPRAADELDMKDAGVVPVVIEPLLNQAAPTTLTIF